MEHLTSSKMKTLAGISLFLIFFQTVQCTETETAYNWTMEHEFSSANACYWNKTMLQVVIEKKIMHINIIDPRLENLVRCSIPNKTGRKWPFDSDYELLSLDNGKALVLQNQTFDIVNLTSCTIDAEFNHTCKPFVLNTDFFDCFHEEQLSEATLSYDRYDDNGKLMGSFKIKRILDLSDDTIDSKVYKSEKPSSKIIYYTWEPKVAVSDLANTDSVPKVKVKILDHEYKLVSEQTIENPNYSVHSFAHGNLTICHQRINLSIIINNSEKKLNKKQLDDLGFIECKLYDRNLKLQSTVKMNLPEEANNEYAHIFSAGYLKVHNLLHGGAVILFQVSSNEVFYRVIETSGKVNEKNEVFYTFEKHFGNIEEELNFDRVYLVEKSDTDRVYCGFFGISQKFSGKCMKL